MRTLAKILRHEIRELRSFLHAEDYWDTRTSFPTGFRYSVQSALYFYARQRERRRSWIAGPLYAFVSGFNVQSSNAARGTGPAKYPKWEPVLNGIRYMRTYLRNRITYTRTGRYPDGSKY
jgi:hypothetical protein